MDRDVLKIKLNETESLIISSDNSGAIGEKLADEVNVPYEVVGYYSFRVAVMECMAARATPISVILHNFCGDDAWDFLIKGINKGIAELSIDNLQIVGSTESNFTMTQSATGVVVIGKRSTEQGKSKAEIPKNRRIAVIGSPLVGDEVIDKQAEVAPLTLFKWCCEFNGIETILPVGSKGIFHELNVLYGNNINLTVDEVESGNLNILKSSGPATCFIITYDYKFEHEIKSATGNLFRPIHININK